MAGGGNSGGGSVIDMVSGAVHRFQRSRLGWFYYGAVACGYLRTVPEAAGIVVDLDIGRFNLYSALYLQGPLAYIDPVYRFSDALYFWTALVDEKSEEARDIIER